MCGNFFFSQFLAAVVGILSLIEVMKFSKVFTTKYSYNFHHLFSMFFGFSVFSYPSARFKISILGFISCLINVGIRFYILHKVYLEITSPSSLSSSKVVNVGMLLIECLLHSSIVLCQIISVIFGKEMFRMMKAFEKFDSKVRFMLKVELVQTGDFIITKIRKEK